MVFADMQCARRGRHVFILCAHRKAAVVQFYPWFKFDFPLFLGVVMYDNEFRTKENKI